MRLVVIASVFAAALIAACGSSSTGTTYDNGNGGSSSSGGTDGQDGGPISELQLDSGEQADANIYLNDPPPPWCGPDGGGSAPPPPGGTLRCPDDKNIEGCPCTTPGQTAPCWPGLRANRHLGICTDGQTTCERRGENLTVWGSCKGAVLPQQGATKGKAACKCFSAGQWKLTNLNVCFVTYGGNTSAPWARSTTMDATGKAECNDTGGSGPPNMPPTKWSDDSLIVDCAGHFKLCYEIKAGDVANPQPSDCSLSGKVCVDGDYLKENVEQPFPSVGPWVAKDTACGAKFQSIGGYGEMSVIGESVRCDKVDDGNGNPYVFNRVGYCKSECNASPAPAGCESCTQGGSGSF